MDTTNKPTVQSSGVSSSRQHFVTLDDLRGLAAIAVALSHGNFIFGGVLLTPHSYLAVDFFYLLSGVVLSHAYDRRLRMGQIRNYFERRVIRLYPMILVGAVLGASVVLTSAGTKQASTWHLVLLLLGACLCFPMLRTNIYPGNNTTAPVNLPTWSLFFELAINTVYGFVAKYLSTGRLIAVIVVSLLAEIGGTMKFGSTNFGSHVVEFPWGFARVAFPFSAGILLDRLIFSRTLRVPTIKPVGLGLMLAAIFMIPILGRFNGATDLILIAVVFPALIILAVKQPPRATRNVFSTWLRDLPYPLYTVHEPIFMWLARIQRAIEPRFHASPYAWIVLGTLLASAFALLMFKLYDEPFRTALSNWSATRAAGSKLDSTRPLQAPPLRSQIARDPS